MLPIQCPASTPPLARSITLVRTPSAIATRVLECLTLDDPELLRTTDVNDVLRCFGWAFAGEPLGERHYGLSRRAGAIDEFLSHNWSTPRRLKFLALALHYNSLLAIPFALSAGLLVLVLSTQLSLTVALPTWSHSAAGQKQGIWCQVIGMLALLVCLIFGGDILALLGRRRAGAFLDRTCVCQTDAALKRRGIDNLAAILSKSKVLLVLYSDAYLQKLWTVFEIAMYLLLYPRGGLVFLPVVFAEVVFWGMAMVALSRAMFEVYDNNGTRMWLTHAGLDKFVIQDLLWPLMTVPSIFVLTAMLRKWAKEQQMFGSRLQDFTIHNATCGSEEDRAMIESAISMYAKHIGLVPNDASRQECLQVFDGMIHKQVRQIFSRRVGRAGIPYRYVVLIYFSYIFYIMDVVSASVLQDAGTWEDVLAQAVYGATVTFASGPIAVACCLSLSRALCSWHACAANLVVGLATFASYNGLLALTWELTERSFAHRGYLAALLAIFATLLAVTYCVYRPVSDAPCAVGGQKPDNEVCELSKDSNSEIEISSANDSIV